MGRAGFEKITTIRLERRRYDSKNKECETTQSVIFDDGKKCIYDVEEDIKHIKSYEDLREIPGLFQQVQLDTSRTCVYWNEDIDLPSDAIYEYGKVV